MKSCWRSSLLVYLLFFIIDACFVVESEQTAIDSQVKHPTYGLSSAFQPGDKFGQISAVTINSYGNVVIFHRGPVVWDSR